MLSGFRLSPCACVKKGQFRKKAVSFQGQNANRSQTLNEWFVEVAEYYIQKCEFKDTR